VNLYIRLQINYWTHRKTLRLKGLIGNDALWLMPRLWSYAAENQPDGDFSDYTEAEIAILTGYTGDASSMLQALQAAGFMDGMKLHNWAEHNEYHNVFSERAKKAAAARWGKSKKRKVAKEKDIRIDKIRIEQASTSIAQAMLQAFPPSFAVEWEHFRKHRKTIKAPMTERSEQLILGMLRERPEQASEALQLAMVSNWRGFKWSWFDDRTGRNDSTALGRRVGGNQI
jgi:hypothetical protein